MAGVQSATLQGWAIAAITTPWWDHTYVTSTCGLKWGCFGRDAGGNGLSAAVGSSIVADCLSQTNSEAGIDYLKTGVCHQAANRILHPANVTVAGARGYQTWAYRFGPYGKPPWPQLLTCYPPGALRGGGGMTAQSNQSERISVYNAKVTAIPKPAGDPMETGRLAELAALIEMKIGPVEEPILLEMFRIQTDLQSADSRAALLLDIGEISPEQYLDRLNEHMRLAMERNRQVLGKEKFDAFFGYAVINPDVPTEERNIFLQKHATKK
jgi:hypothetical protein